MPTFVPIEDDADCEDIMCVVCLQPWDEPVELSPCHHIFCTLCVRTLDKCPECRAVVTARTVPNRILRNMALAVTVTCDRCAWKGTREASRTHGCAKALLKSLLVADDDDAQKKAAEAAAARRRKPGSGVQRPSQPQPAAAAAAAAPAALQPDDVSVLFVNERELADDGFTGDGGNGGFAPAGESPPRPGTATAREAAVTSTTTAGTTSPNAAAATRAVPRPGADVLRESQPWQAFQLSQLEYDRILCVFLREEYAPSLEALAQLTLWLHHAYTLSDLTALIAAWQRPLGEATMLQYCQWLTPRRRDPVLLYNLPPQAYRAMLHRFRAYDDACAGRLAPDVCRQMLLHEKLAFDDASAEGMVDEMRKDAGRRAPRDCVEFDDVMSLVVVGYDRVDAQRRRQADIEAVAAQAAPPRTQPRATSRDPLLPASRQPKQAPACCSIC